MGLPPRDFKSGISALGANELRALTLIMSPLGVAVALFLSPRNPTAQASYGSWRWYRGRIRADRRYAHERRASQRCQLTPIGAS